jgi:hypothetical protein
VRFDIAGLFGGNQRPCRIEAYQPTRSKDPNDTWQRLYLQSGEIPIQHLLHCFPEHFDEIDVRGERVRQFNHCLHWHDRIPVAAKKLVTLLTNTLALPAQDKACDLSLAIDWYKNPLDDGEWENTEVGEIIYRAKYFRKTPTIMMAAQAQLAGRLADVAGQHLALDAAPYLVSVPGSKGDGMSAGERIAATVADLTGKQLVKTIGPPRPERKGDQSCSVKGLFKIPALLDGSCIILDDVSRSYDTLREVGLLAKNAGATSVYALVGAKTRRN